MKSRYKISISNRNVYKEIELTPEMEHLSVGTAVDADVRLRKEPARINRIEMILLYNFYTIIRTINYFK